MSTPAGALCAGFRQLSERHAALVAETVRRALEIDTRVPGHSKARLSSGGEYNCIRW